MSLAISSSAFEHEGAIPARHTCQGEDLSPPLHFSGVPTGAQSLVLVVDDPDAPDPRAPRMTWVHWVVINLPPTTTHLPEGVSLDGLKGATVGVNDSKQAEWGGPCPPIGRHRYYFKLYALDVTLGLQRPTKAQVEKAMEGHVLAQATLMGTYEKH